MDKKSILLTGATGYLGGYLAGHLSKKPDINLQCLVRPRKDGKDELLKKLGIRVIYGNLLNPESYREILSGVDIVIHAATFATLYNHAEEERKLFFEPTRTLIRQCAEHGVGKFIFAGGGAAIGFGLHNADESLPRKRLNFWPHQNNLIKIEELLESYQQEGTIETVIIRSGIYIGKGGGDHSMVTSVAEGLRNKQLPFIGGGKAVVSFVSLYDAAEAFYLAAVSEKSGGQIYHISSGEQITMKEVIDFIADKLGYDPPARSIPFFMAKLLGGLMEILHHFTKKEISLCRTMAYMSGKSLHFSIDKAVKELGYSPKYSWREAVEDTLHGIKT
ncbi:MAG: NAD-dependent epimerase/dehydratase family protein [Spirochaetes bacterium]|nr:NAD-dependent epimerase/dehydratase family protein [Spirochaetota bacterium]